MGIFGFSTEPSLGGDFLPILKYDARAGRFFRMDRADHGQGFENTPVDITANFKAIVDFENLEVGWINFQPGTAPSFALVRFGEPFPAKPTEQHKQGVRFMVKLAKSCSAGDGKDIREVAGTSKAFLSGVENAYLDYQEECANHPLLLPVLALEKTVPIKTGSGERSSTNYTPMFKIVGWVKRGDLAPQPRTNGSGQQPQQTAAPATGATSRRAPPPTTNIADEF
jgi:hypothetical protein